MSLIKKYNELNENNDLETFLRGLSEEERMEIYTNALEGKNLDQDNPIIEEVKTDIDTFIQAALGTDAFRAYPPAVWYKYYTEIITCGSGLPKQPELLERMKEEIVQSYTRMGKPLPSMKVLNKILENRFAAELTGLSKYDTKKIESTTIKYFGKEFYDQYFKAGDRWYVLTGNLYHYSLGYGGVPTKNRKSG